MVPQKNIIKQPQEVHTYPRTANQTHIQLHHVQITPKHQRKPEGWGIGKTLQNPTPKLSHYIIPHVTKATQQGEARHSL